MGRSNVPQSSGVRGMALMDEAAVDRLWWKFIGSHLISERQELEVIRDLIARKALSYRLVYVLYLKTKWWRNIRYRRMKMDGFACVECKSTVMLHVDHLKYRGWGKEWLQDLQTLCYDCHKKKTKRFALHTTTRYRKLGARRVSEGDLFSILRERVADGKS